LGIAALGVRDLAASTAAIDFAATFAGSLPTAMVAFLTTATTIMSVIAQFALKPAGVHLAMSSPVAQRGSASNSRFADAVAALARLGLECVRLSNAARRKGCAPP